MNHAAREVAPLWGGRLLRLATPVTLIYLGATRATDPWRALLPAAIWAIAAVGLGLLLGRGGQPMLCQAAFVAVGAYTYAWIAAPTPTGLGEQPIAALGGAIVAVLLIALLTSPVLRVRGYVFALATIATGLLVHQGMRTGSWLPGANTGILTVPDLSIGRWKLHSVESYVAASLVVLAVAALAIQLRYDRGHRARELAELAHDQDLAAEAGIDVVGLQRELLLVGAGLAAVAGALYASAYGLVQPTTFGLQDSFLLAVAVLVGGRRSTLGAIAGAAALELLGSALGNDLADARVALMGVLLIAAIRWAPDGLIPPIRWRRPLRADHGLMTAGDLLDGGGASLEVEDLVVERAGVRALDRCSLEVAPSTVLAIVGPNGAGKTTLLHAIAGTVGGRGRVRIDGRDIGRRPPHRRARRGLARTHQHLHPDPGASVATIVEGGADLHARATGRTSETGRRRRAASALRILGIEDLAERRVGTLTLAEQRLVDLARLLAAGPRLAILDEPVAGLDARERATVLEFVRLLAHHGATVIVVEHDLSFVQDLEARVVALVDGRVLADGSASEVLSDPAVQVAYLGQEPVR